MMRIFFTLYFIFSLSAAHATDRSRLFENCLVSAAIGAQAKFLPGDPNDAIAEAKKIFEEQGMGAYAAGIAANIELEVTNAISADAKLAVRHWLKFVANGFADEPIEKFQDEAKALARGFEACVLHVYDINLAVMPGWQDTN